jgi:TM2 domain-containing membrane protein YozV
MAMIFCKECGNQMSDTAIACPKCGAASNNSNSNSNNAEVSSKNKTVAFLLCWFLGMFGVHNFYLGRTGKGIFELLTVGGFIICWIIDFWKILLGNYVDGEGKKLV